MANEKPLKTDDKVCVIVKLFPYEKKAFENWITGKYHSFSDAIRSHIRNVTGVKPDCQPKTRSLKS